ncbi:glycosyltransferase family 2 protein [Lacticaseibacillus suibinensis]|uniref:glycosyltransferase family 2 protein n=1 Tax=Lacticaseibacillus suibinensis TaxID=2486011 RepID=UPI001940ABE1|nr:glycosyltransferase family 2 protein [Lacticaseibacillus suibinensis]
MSNSIAAVVVTYNRLTLLKECLNAINENPEVGHVVIVNNKSTDNTAEFLATLDANRYIVFNSTSNLGGAGGFAKGIAIAFQQTQDQYFWILDDDTIPTPGATAALMSKATMLQDDFGFLASDVRWIDGTSCNMPTPTVNWPERIGEGLVGVAKGTFVSILVTRAQVAKLGIPTKELFIWGDDTEYTTRLTQTAPSYFVVDSHVIHKTPNNLTDISLLNDSPERIKRYYYMYRNLVYISKRYQGKKAATRMVISQSLMGFSTLVHAQDHRWARFGAVLRGTFKGIFFNPPVLMATQEC